MQNANGSAGLEPGPNAAQTSDLADGGQDHGDVVATVATVAVVGIGAAVFEAAGLGARIVADDELGSTIVIGVR